MSVDKKDTRYPVITIVGGPDPASTRCYRDGIEMKSIVEFQINGSLDNPVTAIFKEIVVFDGSVELMPRREMDTTSH